MKKYYLFLVMILFTGSLTSFAQGVVNCEEVEGCMDATACNYNEDATQEDNSCTYALENFDCNGLCIDADENGVCDYNQVGCTDEAACNTSYFAGPNGEVFLATEDDGSCEGPQENFNCNGSCVDTDADGVCDVVDDFLCAEDLDDDGVCDVDEVAGCTDPAGCNYNPLATDDDGSCTSPEPDFNCDGTCLDTDADDICDARHAHVK